MHRNQFLTEEISFALYSSRGNGDANCLTRFFRPPKKTRELSFGHIWPHLIKKHYGFHSERKVEKQIILLEQRVEQITEAVGIWLDFFSTNLLAPTTDEFFARVTAIELEL